MKAITVCPNTASGVANGRVTKNRDSENAEIQMYLSKLKDLVPYMPKNRKISKLEVIQYVIDYICDLQNALDTNPAVSAFDAAAAIAGENMLIAEQEQHPAPHSPRQPLASRPTPNTLVSESSSSTTTTPPSIQQPPSNTVSQVAFFCLLFFCAKSRK